MSISQASGPQEPFDRTRPALSAADLGTFVLGQFSSVAEYEVEQPGAGIAKAGLPSTDTSVDRFIRAVFYAQFAEKQSDPDKAVQMVAHIMNNFDRPRGITIDPPNLGSGHLQFEGHAREAIPTEFTTWTSLTDLTRRRLFLRDSGGMNYTYIDLTALSAETEFFTTPMTKLTPSITNSTSAFMKRRQ